MQIRQMIFRKKESLAALFAGVVLVGYIGFLLLANYLSHVELRKSAVERLIEDMARAMKGQADAMHDASLLLEQFTQGFTA